MKRKLLIVLLCVVSAVACVLGISACFDDPDEGHVHSIIHIDKQDATCTKEGNREYWYCTSCGDCFTDEKGENRVSVLSFRIDKLPHDEVIDYAVPATCTEDGKTQGKHCFVCGEVIVEQKRIPAGHTYVIEPAVPATCTEDGLTEGKYCMVCKLVVAEQTVVPAGHTIVDEEEMSATCTEDGRTAYKHCKNCDYIEVQPTTIPATGHSEVDDAAVPATCIAEGKTAGKHCETCNTVTVEPQIIPATGHSLTHNSAQTADCATFGTLEHWSCSVCEKNFSDEDGENEIEDVTVAKTVHNYVEKYICTLCNTGTATFGLQYEYNETEDTYTVTGMGSASGDIIIPHYYNGKLVTAVGDDAFHANGAPWSSNPLTGVVIPDSVVSIGHQGFCECTEMTSITFGKGVASIGGNAFGYCLKLEEINVAEGNTVYHSAGNCLIETASKTIVLGCNKSVIPTDNSVTAIGANAFSDCSLTGDLIIPANIKTIGDWAFHSCSGLTGVIFSEGVTSIGDYVFDYCNDLTEITIPSSVTDISVATFAYCYNLKRVYYYDVRTKWDALMGGSVKTDYDVYCIAEFDYEYIDYTDSYMVSFTTQGTDFGNIILPANHQGKPIVYAMDSFIGCTITGIVIPDGITSFEEGSTFRDSTGLKTLIVGSGLTQCDFVNMFGGGPKATLSEIKVSADNPAYYSQGNCIIAKESKTLVFGCNNSVIPDDGSVTAIVGSAFSGCKQLKSVTVPDSVTSIGGSAFSGCSGLTSVSIGKGVTSLGKFMFAGCKALTNLTVDDENPVYHSAGNCIIETESKTLVLGCENSVIPTDGSVTSIDEYAFAYCTMKSIVIPNKVTSIGEHAFYYSSLESITIPGSVTSIGNYAFYYSWYLTDLTIENGVKEIGFAAFKNCSGLTSVTIPESVTVIKGDAFDDCRDLKTVYWNATECENNYKYSAFGGWTDLSTVVIGNNVKIIPKYLFYYCDTITSVTFGNSVASVGDYAFYECEGITGVYITDLAAWSQISFESSYSNPLRYAGKLYLNGTLVTNKLIIPDGVTAIGDYVFYDYDEITGVAIPSSVTSIGKSAFGGKNLTGVYITDLAAWFNISFEYSWANPLDDAHNLYLNGTLVKELTIPDSVTAIKDYAFYGCSSLTKINVHSGVTSVGKSAFGGCHGLKGVYITDLDAWCRISFADSYSNPLLFAHDLYLNGTLVTELVIPDGVTAIGRYAFENCTGITSVTIPASVTSIGKSAFSDCSALASVYITDLAAWCNISFGDDDSFFEYAFDYGYNLYLNGTLLTELIIPDSVTVINSHAFKDCRSITSLIIHDGVTSIGAGAFRRCTALTSVVIGNGVTSIGDRAFYYCKSLTSVTFGNSVASIGEHAFYYCSSLTSITLSDSVASISSSAFSHCENLTSITIPNSVVSIGYGIIYDDSALTDIYYDGTIADWNEIEKNDFWDGAYKYTIHCSDGDIAKS